MIIYNICKYVCVHIAGRAKKFEYYVREKSKRNAGRQFDKFYARWQGRTSSAPDRPYPRAVQSTAGGKKKNYELINVSEHNITYYIIRLILLRLLRLSRAACIGFFFFCIGLHLGWVGQRDYNNIIIKSSSVAAQRRDGSRAENRFRNIIIICIVAAVNNSRCI